MISVIIPVFNEQDAIARTLRELRDVLEQDFREYEIIIINDGSTDNSLEIIKRERVKNLCLINHIENLGYGKSLLDGILSAKYDCVAIMDADGSYSAKDIKELYPFYPQYDMVVGARSGKAYKEGIFKRPARKLFKCLSEYASGRNIPDINSGLRLFKKEIVLKFQDSLCFGFSFTTTLTLIFLLNHYYVKFVPISYLRRKGKSKINHPRDMLRAGQIIIESILYYNPIKLFLLIGTIDSIFGIAIGALNHFYFKIKILEIISAFCVASFIPIFCFGLIADQLKKIYNLRKT